MMRRRRAIIERGRAELARFAALLLAVLGGAMTPQIYRAALRQMRPLESAVRRLIVVAAQGVTVQRRAVSVMPEGGILMSGGAGRVGAFPLFDPRRRVGVLTRRVAGAGPRIRFFDEAPLDAPEPKARPDLVPDPAILRARLARVTRALGRVEEEARRLARWRLRHLSSLKIPMRPGRPPGFIARAKRDVIQILLMDLDLSARIALTPD